MRTLVTLTLFALRLLALWFLSINALGFLWFLGQHGFMTLVYLLATSLAFVTFALMPRRLMLRAPYRRIVLNLSGVVLFVTFHQIYGDLTLINGADYPAAQMRLLACVIFVSMFLEALYFPREVQSA